MKNRKSRSTQGVFASGLLLLSGACFPICPVAGAETEPEKDYLEISLGHPLAHPPAISPNGDLYLSFNGPVRRLAAFSRTGEFLWEFVPEPLPGAMSLPVIDASGRIYFGGPGRKLFALNPDGTSEWEMSLPAELTGPPALTGDGVLVFATGDQFMNAVLDGESVWRTRANTTQYSAPAVASDGTIYFLNEGLAKMTPNGTLVPGLSVSCSNFSLARDGSVYFRSLQPWSLAKFDPATETVVWNFLERIDPPPLIAADGRIYCVAGQRLFQVNPDGSLAAEYDLEKEVRILTPLTLAADGTVFACSRINQGQGFEGVLFKVAPDFASHQEYNFGPGWLTPVALGPDGTVYVGNSEGKLFIIEGNSPLPDHAWPSTRLDAAHTANLAGPSPAPGMLSNLAVTEGNFAGMIQVSWDEPPVFAQIDLYRGTGPDFGQARLLAEKLPAGAPFDDYGVEAGAVYYYWAEAGNPAGSSPPAGPVPGHSAPDAEVLWMSEIGLNMPAIGPDGTLYAAAAHQELFALDGKTGAVKWTFPGIASGDVPAIAPNGWIIGRTSWDLYALNPEGELQWQVEGIPHRSTTWPAISEDGVIYWGFSEFLRALTLDGEEKWTLEFDSRIEGAPAIGLDGLIYFTTRSGHLRVIDAEGTEQWALELEPETSAPVIGLDGTIYVMGKSSRLYAVHPDGSLKWDVPFSLHQSSFSECVVAPNGTVVAPGVTAFGPDGTQQWHAKTFSAAPPLASRDSVIFSAAGDRLQALDSDGNLLWEYLPPAPPGSQPLFNRVLPPALSEDGTLYFGFFFGITTGMVALKTPYSASLEGWTQFRGNAQRTRRPLPAATRPSLTARLGGNPAVLVLEIFSPAEARIRIEYSEDLKTWNELGTIQASPGTSVTEEPIQANQRFYRFVVE